MAINRKLKNSLFSWLFSEPDTLRELYGALEGITLALEYLRVEKSRIFCYLCLNAGKCHL